MSRPSRSSSSETRRPTTMSMTLRMMKLPTPVYTKVVHTAPSCTRKSASAPLMSLTLNTPVSRALTFDHPLREHPGQRGNGGGELSHDHGHPGAAVGGDRGTRVETEPTDPQQ